VLNVRVRFRAPVDDDAPAVLGVFAAREVADGEGPGYTLASLREQWSFGDFDLGADAVVVEAPGGELVAYADVRRPGTTAIVAPAHERKGIGRDLLEWAERREAELGRAHRQLIAAANARAAELLRSTGYVHVRSHFRMTRELDAGVRAGELPVGVALRSVDLERDAEALHALDALCFAGNADYEAESLAEFCDEHLHGETVAPGLSFVVQRGPDLVGFLVSHRFPDAVGYIGLLGVHPDHRRGGLGTALLTRAFADYAAEGLRHAQLLVASDNPRGLALYERAGMRVLTRFDAYKRPAAPS
jgi:mycothiol synthase